MTDTKDIPFSNKDRKESLRRLQEIDIYDLVIIGGGITGAGIALDASLRGIKTLLIEKADFASGTSSKSTKLIHGGLRYLKQFEIGLVRESGLEREVLHNSIPHLVHPKRMMLPIVKKGGFDMFTALIAVSVYDFLARVKNKDRKKKLNKEEALEAEPLLPESRLKGAITYAEYRTDDARLTIELIKAARRHGAKAYNYLELVAVDSNGIDGQQLHCVDNMSGEKLVLKAKSVVSAAGPWVDKVRAMTGPVRGKTLHLTKGVHIVVEQSDLPVKSSIYFDTTDGRMIFVIPRDRVCYIGTTDTDYHEDLNKVVCTREDAQYLIDNVNLYFDGISIDISNVISSWAGLRPLIHEEGKSPSELSRKDEIFIGRNGLVTIAGGKLTGYRMMAKKLVDLLQDKGMVHGVKECQTRDYKIHADSFDSYGDYQSYINQLQASMKEHDIKRTMIKYLVDNYGKNTGYILSGIDHSIKESDEAILRSEILFTIEYEAAILPCDFYNRRSGLLYFNPARIKTYLDIILDTFAEYFQWTSKQKEQQKNKMKKLIRESINFVSG